MGRRMVTLTVGERLVVVGVFFVLNALCCILLLPSTTVRPGLCSSVAVPVRVVMGWEVSLRDRWCCGCRLWLRPVYFVLLALPCFPRLAFGCIGLSWVLGAGPCLVPEFVFVLVDGCGLRCMMFIWSFLVSSLSRVSFSPFPCSLESLFEKVFSPMEVEWPFEFPGERGFFELRVCSPSCLIEVDLSPIEVESRCEEALWLFLFVAEVGWSGQLI
ncbi:hypothetical protein SUGI_0424370 [Cryptomeria japonica]|nr:hypothetical protein SUGI_0424370 [Cryptomeria japonica]